MAVIAERLEPLPTNLEVLGPNPAECWVLFFLLTVPIFLHNNVECSKSGTNGAWGEKSLKSTI